MSIDIDWSALTNPSSHSTPASIPPTDANSYTDHDTSASDPILDGALPNDLALSIRDFIHDKFQTLTLPRFIRRVHVHDFDFGKEAPEVRLLDVTDPLGEFYESEDEEDEDGEEGAEGQEVDAAGGHDDAAKILQDATAPMSPPKAAPTGMGNLQRPITSTTVTPGLGITAASTASGGGFGYFHLPPLKNSAHGLVSGTATPLQTSFLPSPFAAPPPIPPPSSHPPPSPTPSKSRDRDLDLQTTLHIKYDGTMSLGVTAEVMLDYPMPSFVGIPLELRICGVRFDGVGVVAYLKGKSKGREGGGAGEGEEEGSKGKVKFCFLGEEEARVLLAGEVEEGGDGEGVKREGKGGEVVGGGLLKEIRIESEIGRKGEGKQVLKNVGKVERFVLEQVRRIFEEEFVWPSFWTVLV